MRKPDFCICENKGADQLRVFATQIVKSLYFLNTKFQASSHLMQLYSPVSVGSGRKPPEDRFSHNEALMRATLVAAVVNFHLVFILTGNH